MNQHRDSVYVCSFASFTYIKLDVELVLDEVNDSPAFPEPAVHDIDTRRTPIPPYRVPSLLHSSVNQSLSCSLLYLMYCSVCE